MLMMTQQQQPDMRRASVGGDYLISADDAAASMSREEFLQMRQRSLSTPNTPKMPPQAPMMAAGRNGSVYNGFLPKAICNSALKVKRG